MMRKFTDLSIQKKLFSGMLLFSIFTVVVITSTAVKNTYDTMKEQLIYNRRMSIGWLQDRLEMELSGIQNRFYEFEVDQSRKELIEEWCTSGRKLDYLAQWSLITAMNEAVSMDSNMNSMEIINLSSKETLLAERSGAGLQDAGSAYMIWQERKADLQSNLVFYRAEKEILVYHQMHRFKDKMPYALIVMHLRPYNFQDILNDIKMTTDESIFILNDEGQFIETDSEGGDQKDSEDLQEIAYSLEQSQRQEFIKEGTFWFYRKINGGKLQVLLSVPNYVIVESLTGTVLVAVMMGAVMLILCAVGSVFLSRILSNPIIRLSHIMRNFMLNDNAEAEQNDDGNENSVRQGENEIAILQNSFSIMVAKNKKLIAQEYQIKLEKREAQIHALQAQINPHFMYNVMQVIGGMALQREAPEIYRVTNALSDLMRYCLNFSREMVALKEEIHYLRSYCMLQNERFNDRIILQINVEEKLMNYQIPKLILQPILENSFHHGLVNRSGNWILTVESSVVQDMNGEILLLTVTDNGIGIPPDRLKMIRENLRHDANIALKTEAHIGLCNVDARIRLKYPEGNYGLSIDSTEGVGTTVRIRMKAVLKETDNEHV